MLKKIVSRMQFPVWATEGSRWRTLTVYDKLLDGTFYDHLIHSFYDEQDQAGRDIELIERRPSAQYHLPRYVARWAARKLFAGRHIPKVRSKDKDLETKINDLLTSSHIWPTMFEAAYRGSVGSVAVTFRYAEGKGFALKVWRAVWCSPTFDDFGELVNLRVHYCVGGRQLQDFGLPAKEPNRQYWFVRDYNDQKEITYRPVLESDWNPVEGERNANGKLVIHEQVNHDLGFVPGIWITNPGGCVPPDGSALWEDAIANSIEIDYLLSQAARGARYNCAPELVTQGEVLNTNDGKPARGPTKYLAFAAARKGEDGEMIGGGDAKLLEMTGSGSEAALKIVEQLKRLALEQIGVVQKDPKDMPGPLSGRAMEYLDEDAHDTAMQWRTTYGDGGVLPLLGKMLHTIDPEIDTKNIFLQWPRIYLPTPADLQSIAQAMQILATPQAVAGTKSGEDGSVPIMAPLLDAETARAFVLANIDMGLLDDTDAGRSPSAASGDPAPNPEGAQGSGAGSSASSSPFWRVFPPIKVDA